MAREKKFSTEELFKATKKVILEYGYDGFVFGLLAAELDVARGTLYRYYENKEELITDFMIYEMEQFLAELKKTKQYDTFEEQFDYLLDLIFTNREIHQMLGVAHQVPASMSEKIRVNKGTLDRLHTSMYQFLQDFVDAGKAQKKIKSHLPNGLILGMIFQSIAIPNHFRVSMPDWTSAIKEIFHEGMFM